MPASPLPPAVRALTRMRQPDAVSCGAASLVVARALADPAYAAGLLGPGGRPDPDRWATAVLGTHREVTGLRDRGRIALPYPRLLGTPPWAVARRMDVLHPGPAPRWRPVPVLPGREGAALPRVRETLGAGLPVPLYVGSRLLPRHVVLVLPGEPTSPWRAYDPARGAVVALAEQEAADGRVSTLAWPVVWAWVLPR